MILSNFAIQDSIEIRFGRAMNLKHCSLLRRTLDQMENHLNFKRGLRVSISPVGKACGLGYRENVGQG